VNKLHIHRITSVGAVENPDNPESEILIFKSGALDPSGVSPVVVGGGRRPAGLSLSPTAKAELVTRVRPIWQLRRSKRYRRRTQRPDGRSTRSGE
jgi:hypothetical protein